MWSVYLDPEAAGGPYTLTVTEIGSAAAKVSVEDLLVGDVWFASGQSNMEMPLKGFGPETPIKDSAKEIAAATHPRIRPAATGDDGECVPDGRYCGDVDGVHAGDGEGFFGGGVLLRARDCGAGEGASGAD